MKLYIKKKLYLDILIFHLDLALIYKKHVYKSQKKNEKKY